MRAWGYLGSVSRSRYSSQKAMLLSVSQSCLSALISSFVRQTS